MTQGLIQDDEPGWRNQANAPALSPRESWWGIAPCGFKSHPRRTIKTLNTFSFLKETFSENQRKVKVGKLE